MVGDQQQLTATVFSPHCRAALYDRSLFQRLIETGHPYIMLDTQYRMCSAISQFPSEVFYKGMLKDGANVCGSEYLPVWLKHNQNGNSGDGSSSAGTSNQVENNTTSTSTNNTFSSTCNAPVLFSPFMFFDLHTSSEMQGPAGSHSNLPEAFLCTSLIHALLATGTAHTVKSLGSIGVITFYSDQLQLLKKTMSKHNFPIRLANAPTPASSSTYGEPQPTCSMTDLELNTVDGFQGKETDIIIISAVRANEEQLIGFLSDLRRMNVGLTRARKGLFIVGHAPTLYNSGNKNNAWRKLIDYAHKLDAVVTVQDERDDLLNLLRYRNGVVEARDPSGSTFSDALKRYSNGATGKNGSSNGNSRNGANQAHSQSQLPQQQQQKQQQQRAQYKDRDYSKQVSITTNAHTETSTTRPAAQANQPLSASDSGNDSSSSTLVPIGSNIVVNKNVVGWVNPTPTVLAPRPPPPLPSTAPPVPVPMNLTATVGLAPHPVLPAPPAFRPPPPPGPPPATVYSDVKNKDNILAPKRPVDPRLARRSTPSPPAVPSQQSTSTSTAVADAGAPADNSNNATHKDQDKDDNATAMNVPRPKSPVEKTHMRVCKDRDYSQFSDLTYPVVPDTAVVFPTPKLIPSLPEGVHAPAPVRSRRRDTRSPSPITSVSNLGGVSAPIVDLTNNIHHSNNSSSSRKRKADEVIDLEDGEVVDLT